jgi:hypothetical protein
MEEQLMTEQEQPLLTTQLILRSWATARAAADIEGCCCCGQWWELRL